MIVTKSEQVKFLLKSQDLKNKFFQSILDEQEVNYSHIISTFMVEIQERVEEYEIEEEWDEKYREFYDEGYSREDIRFESYQEAMEDSELKQEIYYEIAHDILNNSNYNEIFYIDSFVEYLKKQYPVF